MTIEQGMLSKYGGNGVTRKTKDQTYIYIDQDWYNKRGYLIESTIFHELGHAKLERGHNNSWSLMNPQISAGKEWIDYKEYLLNELFR